MGADFMTRFLKFYIEFIFFNLYNYVILLYKYAKTAYLYAFLYINGGNDV